MTNKVPQFGLRIPQPLRDELKAYASQKQQNLTRVILDALRFYLDNQ